MNITSHSETSALRTGVNQILQPELLLSHASRLNQSTRTAGRLTILMGLMLAMITAWATCTTYDQNVVAFGTVTMNRMQQGTGDLPSYLNVLLDAPMDQVLVSVGDEFKEGDLLASQDIEQQRIDLRETEQEIANSQQQTSDLKRIRAHLLLDQRPETRESSERSQLQLEMRVNQLLGNINVLKIKAEKLQREMGLADIKAPYDGVVVETPIAQGNFAHTGDKVLGIAVAHRPWLFEAEIDPQDIGRIRNNLTVLITPETYDRTRDEPLCGRVVRTPQSAYGKDERKTYFVTVQVDSFADSQHHRIKLGTRGQIVIQTGQSRSWMSFLLDRVSRKFDQSRNRT